MIVGMIGSICFFRGVFSVGGGRGEEAGERGEDMGVEEEEEVEVGENSGFLRIISLIGGGTKVEGKNFWFARGSADWSRCISACEVPVYSLVMAA